MNRSSFTPPTHPVLDLSHLTPEELEQLKKVFKKQEEFEKEIEQSISGLKKTLDLLQDSNPASLISTQTENTSEIKPNNISFRKIVDNTLSSSGSILTNKISINNNNNNKNQSSLFSKLSLSSLNNLNNKICSICKRPIENKNNNNNIISSNQNLFRKLIFKNVEYSRQDSIMQCADCANHTCKTCGDFVNKNSFKVSIDKPVDRSVKWRCKICIVKREVVKKSGMWTQTFQKDSIINEIKSNIFSIDTSQESINSNNHLHSIQNLASKSQYDNQENATSLPTSPKFRNLQSKKLQTNNQETTSSDLCISNFNKGKTHLNVPEYTNSSSSAETITREDNSDKTETINQPHSTRSSGSNSPDLNLEPLNKQPAYNQEQTRLIRKFQNYIGQSKNSHLSDNVLKDFQKTTFLSNRLSFINPNKNFNYLESPLQMELSTPPPLFEPIDQPLPSSTKVCNSPPAIIQKACNTPNQSKLVNTINKSPVRIQPKSKLAFDPIVCEDNRRIIYSDNDSDLSSSADNNNFFVPIPFYSSSIEAHENQNEQYSPQIYYGNFSGTSRTNNKIKTYPKRTLPSTELVKKNQQRCVVNAALNDSIKNKRNLIIGNNQTNNKSRRRFKYRANSLTLNNLITTNVFKKSQSIQSIEFDLKRINEFIRMESNTSNKSNNDLNELAKVLLIEFKRSLKKSDTTATEDSPISFRSINSQSLSSRQDSSMSAGNDNVIDDRSVNNSRLRPYVFNEAKRNQLRNSEEWHNRRKDIMKKTKRWSNVIDQNQKKNLQNNKDANDSFHENTDESFVSNCDLNIDTTEIVQIEEKTQSTKSTITHCIKSNQISIYHSDLSRNSTESTQSTNNNNNNNVVNSNESNHSNESSSSLNNKVIVPRQGRKLPKIPNERGQNNDEQTHEKKVFNSQKSRRTRASLDCNDSLKRARKTNDSDSLSNSKHFSKSIDSIIEQNTMKNYLSLSFKSVQKSLNSPQRSIDYPYILRKTPKLSDIVRKRLLFQKVSRHATLFDDWCVNSSTEKEHVPKAVRKMIIRQDNSIEISMSRPPKLRQHTMSEDMTTTEVSTVDVNPNAMQGLIVQNTSMLSVSSIANDRRKTIETCENIFLQSEESTKLRARTPPSNPHRILLYKDKSDNSVRTNGLGMRIIGGHEYLKKLIIYKKGEDGSLGCFVTLVIKGGPADMNNIEVGDQILEFNGHSLIDSTYEEVRYLQNNSGDYVQLVVQHNNIRSQIGSNGSPIGISRHFQTVPRLCQSSSRRRRNLPPLPSSSNQENSQLDNKQSYVIAETLHVPNTNNTLRPILINRGRLLMQIWNDIENSKLAITINQATNLPSRSESEQWSTYVIGRVIFEEQSVQNFQTRPILGTNPVWSETFVFSYVEPLEDVNIEIYLHDTQTPSDTRILQENFIGMIMLPLSEANLEDEPRWYDMKDKPTRKNSNTSVTFKSSSNDSQDSLCEKRKSTSRHSSRKSSMYKNENLTNSASSNGKIFSPVRKLSQVFSRLFRRSSESGVKRNLIRFENEEEENIYPLEEQSVASSRSSRSARRRHTELLTVNFLLPPDVITMDNKNNSTKKLSIIETEEDIDYYFKSQLNHQNPGVGQVNPKLEDKNSLDDLIIGDIKLGFLMSKGQLEITIFEARNLKKLESHLKDTYVKTYLRTGTHRLQKRKTHVVRNSNEPVFNSKLLYNACNVLGRRIQVIMIWQKAPKLDKNQCVGEAFIQLDHLDLSHQTIGWYKLYKQNAVESEFYDST